MQRSLAIFEKEAGFYQITRITIHIRNETKRFQRLIEKRAERRFRRLFLILHHRSLKRSSLTTSCLRSIDLNVPASLKIASSTTLRSVFGTISDSTGVVQVDSLTR